MNRTDESGGKAGDSLGTALEAGAKALKALAANVRRAEKGQVPASKVVPQLEQGSESLANVAALVEPLRALIKALTEGQERSWLELEVRLKELCESRKWRIDGSWPSFMVDYGVQINFDDRARAVHVSTTKVAGAQIAAIESELSKRVANLVPRDFSPERFIEDLFAAHQDAKRSATQVPVQDVYRSYVIRSQRAEFWKNAVHARFFEVTIEQFRARLSRTLEAGKVKTKEGAELRLYPPLDPKDGLFLYNPVDRRLGFIGRIEFATGA
jgi:hypothetical protein